MNYEDKISQAIENSKIQNRLRHAGVYPMIGPTGPSASLSATSYEAIVFVSFAQAHYSRVMSFQDTIKIPDEDEAFKLLQNDNISVIKPGIYEITLCGQISGVDQNHGAIFYLIDTTGTVIQDLSFDFLFILKLD